MSGVNIEIDVYGIDAIQRALNYLAQAGEDLREPLDGIGEHLLNAHLKRWEREQSPEGIPWEPLSEQYTARKRQERPTAGTPA